MLEQQGKWGGRGRNGTFHFGKHHRPEVGMQNSALDSVCLGSVLALLFLYVFDLGQVTELLCLKFLTCKMDIIAHGGVLKASRDDAIKHLAWCLAHFRCTLLYLKSLMTYMTL